MLERCRSDELELCREMVSKYGLTEARMHEAAERYRLGRSKSGKPIYWMIDDLGIVCDGHIGDDDWSPSSWVSSLLASRFPPELASVIPPPQHCLFGLHLTSLHPECPVAIVESPRSAVILSALYPQRLWLATVYPANLSERLLAPLQGRPVMMFPPTDETMDHYLAWLEVADQARRKYGPGITVSALLEDHATADQKRRKIDLLDYYFE